MGNTIEEPFSFTFYSDQLPPTVTEHYPAEVTTDSTPTIRLVLQDNLSGIDSSSISLAVNGTEYDLTSISLSLIGDTLIFQSESAGIEFAEEENVTICLNNLSDNSQLCGPNELEEPYCFDFIVSLLGPVARLSVPSAGSYISCDSSGVVIWLFDPDGVDSSTIELSSTPFSFSWQYRPDSLFLTPEHLYSDGDSIVITLEHALDTLGNDISHLYQWWFGIDRSPPVLVSADPSAGATVPTIFPTIRLEIADSLSGIDATSITVEINDSVYTLSSTQLSYSGGEIIIDGINFEPDQEVELCLHIDDQATLCEPNSLDSCYTFTVIAAGPIASAIRPQSGEVVSCDSMRVEFAIWDTDASGSSSAGPIDLSRTVIIYGPDTIPGFSELIEYIPEESLLTVSPVRSFGGGTEVEVTLLSAPDTLGNPLSESVTIDYTIDITSPVLDYSSVYGGQRYSPPDSIWIVISDSPAGIDTTSFTLSILGDDYSYNHPSISFNEDTIIFYPEIAGLTFPEEENIRLCFGISDEALYCGPNSLDSCLTFIVSSRPPDISLAHPPSGSYYSCLTESIQIAISDTDGVNPASIMVIAGEETLTVRDGSIQFAYPNLTFLPPTIASGDTLWIEQIQATDSIGNTALLEDAYYFIYDPDPPVVSPVYPTAGDSITTPLDTLRLYITDSLAGLDTSSVEITITEEASETLWVEGDSLFIVLSPTYEGDSIGVCIQGEDMVTFCPPNQVDTCFSWVYAPPGPSVQLIYPEAGSYTSCESDTIILSISSQFGIIPESIRIVLNDRMYEYSDSLLHLYGEDSVAIYPYHSFGDGDTIRIEVVNLLDTLEHNIVGETEYEFYVDLSPPTLEYAYPADGETIPSARPDFIFIPRDNLSGMDWGSVTLTINGEGYTRSIIHLEGDTLFMPGSALRNPFEFGDTVTVSLHICDRALYCAPNCTTYTYDFICGARPPNIILLNPNRGSYTSCRFQEIVFLVEDEDSIAWEELELTVDSIAYTLDSSQVTVSGDSIIYTPGEPYIDGEIITGEFSVPDIYDNWIAEPVSFNFTVDLTPPQFSNSQPHTPVTDPEEPISLTITDLLSGVDFSSIAIIITRRQPAYTIDTITLSTSGVVLEDDSLIFEPHIYNEGRTCNDSGAIWFYERDTVKVKVMASDRVTYCGANTGVFEWAFYVSDDDTVAPQFISFQPESVLQASYSAITVEAIDPSGIDSGWVVIEDTDSIPLVVSESYGDTALLVSSDSIFVETELSYQVYLYDSDTDCGILSDRSLSISEIVDVSIVPRVGPTAEIITPIDSLYSSCEYQPIVLLIHDEEGVDSSSVILTVQQDTVTELNFAGDTISYIPTEPWIEGDTIHFALLEALDNYGNSLQEPVSGFFISDRTGPFCRLINPSELVYITESERIITEIYDSLSGVDEETIQLTINGRSLNTSSSGITYTDNNLVITPWQFITDESESLIVIIENAMDRASYCGANTLEGRCSYLFKVEPKFSCDAIPVPFTPNDDSFNDRVKFIYPHLETQQAELYIYTPDGKRIFYKELPPGSGENFWDGRTNDGVSSPAGGYIYVITQDGKTICRDYIILAR